MKFTTKNPLRSVSRNDMSHSPVSTPESLAEVIRERHPEIIESA